MATDAKTHELRNYAACLGEFGIALLYWIFAILKSIAGIFVSPTKKSLKNETVLITGGANGIGREICRRMAQLEKNFKLVIWDVDEPALNETVLELQATGVKEVRGYVVDVADRKAVEECGAKVRTEVGEVTILINNAGVAGPFSAAWRMEPEEVIRTMTTDLVSHHWLLRKFLPPMLRSDHGHVVEVCSLLSFCAIRGASPYVASKHGLKAYIESVKEDIRFENPGSKVKVTMVFPGFTKTRMVTSTRFRKYPFLLNTMEPEYVADKIVDGLLKNKEYVYVPKDAWWASWIVPLLPMDVSRKLLDICDITQDIEETQVPKNSLKFQ